MIHKMKTALIYIENIEIRLYLQKHNIPTKILFIGTFSYSIAKSPFRSIILKRIISHYHELFVIVIIISLYVSNDSHQTIN